MDVIEKKKMKKAVTFSNLFDISSSSPPQPQKEFENPFTSLNCFTVIAETPPKIPLYGSLN